MHAPGKERLVTIGQVDLFHGSYLTGWAISASGKGISAIEITNEEGRVVGSGLAMLSRPDLAALGYDRNDFAFRVPVTDFGASSLLFVRADGIELGGSPVRVGSGIFDGQIAVSDGNILGWVVERKPKFSAPSIQIFDQYDQLIVSGASTVDKSGDDLLFAPARFRLRLPDICLGRSSIELRALAGAQVFARTACNLRLVGNLDGVWPDRVAGWLFSPDARDRRLRLVVRRDGMLVGEGSCNLPRQDLRDLYPMSSDIGFDIKLFHPHLDSIGTSELSVRLVDSSNELFDGPFVVGRRSAIITTARRIAGAAHTPGVACDAAERSVLQAAMAGYIGQIRNGNDYVFLRRVDRRRDQTGQRLTVLIPVYRNIDITQSCIISVLTHRNPSTDEIIIINDASPDLGMAEMLQQFTSLQLVYVITNETNCGFIYSINRGLEMCRGSDVLLLNSDTQMYEGGLEELYRIAHSAPDIGTVTAMSNNATIFSYPHPSMRVPNLNDVTWSELAIVALQENRGLHVDVPTGHGFCMLIKRVVLDYIPRLNEVFGRGYGEENELCLRAADLGYRHVAAAGVFVEHVEEVSFGQAKQPLLVTNLKKLETMFPEYAATVAEFEKHDELRCARWPLDAFRLRKARDGGFQFVLVIEAWFGGGSQKAVDDIEAAVGYGGAVKLRLVCTSVGNLVLEVQQLHIRAIFSSKESAQLFELLGELSIELAVVHQLIGFPGEFIERLGSYVEGKNSIYCAHDFFPICPRATMIDAVGEYCARAETSHCVRCVGVGGAHEASRLGDLDPPEHRKLFGRFLARVRHIVAPSRDTAGHFMAVFPQIRVLAVPHPQYGTTFASRPRRGDPSQVVLLGAIGAHKGSVRLLELAKIASLTHPHLHFHVIGYTDIDDQLSKLSNVSITGRYVPNELLGRIDETRGSLALFLHEWPETFSYTLTEAVAAGLVPIVPDIGAPAERVRDAHFGIVYPFPIEVRSLLVTLDDVVQGRFSPSTMGGSPASYATPISPGIIARLAGIAEKVATSSKFIVPGQEVTSHKYANDCEVQVAGDMLGLPPSCDFLS